MARPMIAGLPITARTSGRSRSSRRMRSASTSGTASRARAGHCTQRLVDELGGDLARLDRVGDPLAVEGVHRAGGVADQEHPGHRLRRPVDPHRQRARAHGAISRLLADAPRRRQHPCEGVEQPLRRDVLESLEGVEQPGAEVDPASGDREEPAVAGQQQVAVPQVEPGLDPRTRVVVDAVVAAGGDPERPDSGRGGRRPASRSGSRRRRRRARTVRGSPWAPRRVRRAGRTRRPATYPSPTSARRPPSARAAGRPPSRRARARRWSNPSRGITSPNGGNVVRSGQGSWIVVRRACTRSPITRSNRGSSVSTPMSWIALTSAG